MERRESLQVDGRGAPHLPRGQFVDLPGRGAAFVRECGTPHTGPTVILLHGLGATASLNWLPAFHALGRQFHVLALDLRGHGHGIRDGRPFTLEDAADDAVALADVLGVEQFIAVGYSMGGPIAQLIWQRHRERVRGLVLCATAYTFCRNVRERFLFASIPLLEGATRVAPEMFGSAILSCVSAPFLAAHPYGGWARAELMSVDRRTVLQAGSALGRYSAGHWIREIDAPSAVLVHRHDQLVPPARQLALAARIPGASAYVVDADHFAPVRQPERFTRMLVTALDDVASREAVPSVIPIAS